MSSANDHLDMIKMTSNSVTREHFDKGRKLLREADIAYWRACMIHACSPYFASKFGYSDWHGVIEALQHCFELSLKAMWEILGMKFPQEHNPIKGSRIERKPQIDTLDDLNERMFAVLPHMRENELFERWVDWVTTKADEMEKLHKTTIYGDEQTGKMASELFSEPEVNKKIYEAQTSYLMTRQLLLSIGHEFSYLTPEEEEEFQSKVSLVELIKTENLASTLDDLVKTMLKIDPKHSRISN